jgi:YihY family inner membrane protein
MSISTLLHLEDLDRIQQRHRTPAFVLAVLKKYSEDQGGQLAALVAYYGFVSLFPLLLVFVTVLGFVLQGDPDLEQRIVKGALGRFPLVKDPLTAHGLSGSGIALTIGLALTLLGGLGIMSTLQLAFNRIWAVPFSRRPDFLTIRLRGIGALCTLGALTVCSTLVGGSLGTATHGAAEVIAAALVALAFNVALYAALFRMLTAAHLRWRQLLPGVLLGAVLWQPMQYLGGLYIGHELKRTQPLYGTFALVLGLLAWLYLGAQLTLLAAEVNVVRDRRLWPRTLFSPALLDADRRALRSSALAQSRSGEEHIEVRFGDPPDRAGPSKGDEGEP